MSIFKLSAAANVVFLFLPVTLALIIAVSMQTNPNSPLFYLGIFSMMVGWLLLVASKWDQVRKGDLWTFGISRDRLQMRFLYRASYVVMICGWLMACFSR